MPAQPGLKPGCWNHRSSTHGHALSLPGMPKQAGTPSMTRATDAAGKTQPAAIPFNEKGFLFNQPLPHPIVVK